LGPTDGHAAPAASYFVFELLGIRFGTTNNDGATDVTCGVLSYSDCETTSTPPAVTLMQHRIYTVFCRLPVALKMQCKRWSKIWEDIIGLAA